MRDYDMEELLMHYGIPGMKRPRGLKYKTRRNASTSLYANRKSQMYGRNRTDDDSDGRSKSGTTKPRSENKYIKKYAGSGTRPESLASKAAKQRENERQSVQNFKNKTSSVRGKMAMDKLMSPAVKSKRIAEEDQANRKENAKKFVNLSRDMHNTAKKANATMRAQKEEATKKKYEQDKPKLMENMRNSNAYVSVIRNYNNIQKRRKLQDELNKDPAFRSEVSKSLKDTQTKTLNNLGIKTESQRKENAKKFISSPATNKAKVEKPVSDPRNYQNQTLSNLGIKKKKKKKS